MPCPFSFNNFQPINMRNFIAIFQYINNSKCEINLIIIIIRFCFSSPSSYAAIWLCRPVWRGIKGYFGWLKRERERRREEREKEKERERERERKREKEQGGNI